MYSVSRYTEFWDCQACTSVNQCPSPNNPYNLGGECYDGGITDNCHADFITERHYLGPLLNVSNPLYFCDFPHSFECMQNYFLSATGDCVSCTQLRVQCPKGQHPVRCKTDDVDCLHCSLPSLVNKGSAFRYGFGRLYEDCLSVKDAYQNNVVGSTSPDDQSEEYWRHFFQRCAFLHTPRWNQGYCSVECSSGYTMTRAQAHLLDYPDCAPCKRNCTLGTMAPPCVGQSSVQAEDNGGECIPCNQRLPVHAHWTGQGCAWECDVGFWVDGEICRSCTENNLTCSNPNAFFMNCSHSFRGACIKCFQVCSDEYYFSHELWQSECDCLPCTQPSMGKTFVIANCSKDKRLGHDTKLGICSQNCSEGFYMKRNCTLNANSVCVPCTAPKMGLLLTRRCSVYSDAQYDACPVNYTCNGSAIPQTCPSHLRPVNGICVCPSGMQFSGDLCVPLFCEDGKFSDPVTGLCRNCSSYVDIENHLLIRPHSNPRIMGVNACFCPPQYFIHHLENSLIACSPCGDLDCRMLDFETQEACTGRSATEPQCICSLPPGSRRSNTTACRESFSCSDGYGLTSAVWGDYDYESYNFLYTAGSLTSNSSMEFEKPKTALFLGSDYFLALLEDGKLLLTRLSTRQSSYMDLSFIQEVNNQKRQSDIKITEIRLHSRGDYTMGADTFRIWISFTYTGYCESFEEIVEGCSAIELYSLVKQTTEVDVTFCRLYLCVSWHIPEMGSDYQMISEGSRLQIQTFVFGRNEDSDYHVYVLVNQHSVFRHALRFSEQSSQGLAFQLVYEISPAERSFARILDMETGIRGLYVLTQHDQLSNNLKVLQSKSVLLFLHLLTGETHFLSGDVYNNAQSLLSLNYNLVFVYDLYNNFVLDSWNRYASTYFPDEFQYLSMPHVVLSTWNPMSDSYFQFLAFDHLKGEWRLVSRVSLCPPDFILHPFTKNFQADPQCALALCVVQNPCGANTFRDYGSNLCKCKPGYQAAYHPTGALLNCIPCSAANNEYCVGQLLTSQYCPPNSVVSKDLASSVSDCFCKPGFFKQLGGCAPCTLNVFCPYHDMLIPIPCNHLGLTEFTQQVYPQSCYCPKRTWGLTCIPCLDTEICPILDSFSGQLPPLMEIWNVEFHGFIHNHLDFQKCLDKYVAGQPDAYTMYNIPRGYSSEVDNMTVDNFIYFKILVHLKFRDAYFQNNIDLCMRYSNVKIAYKLLANNFRPPVFRERKNCGEINGQPGFWEWNGIVDSNLEDCVCVAGYEPVSVDEGRWRDSIKCYPCLNGTHRKKGSSGRCIACADREREHAPYLAMSECICKSGYVRSPNSLLCELASEELSAFIEKTPAWYSLMSVQFNVIIIASSISIAFLVVLSVFAYFIY